MDGRRRDSEVASSKMTFGKNTPSMSENGEKGDQPNPEPEYYIGAPNEQEIDVESSVALSSPEQEPMPYGRRSEKSNGTFDLS